MSLKTCKIMLDIALFIYLQLSFTWDKWWITHLFNGNKNKICQKITIFASKSDLLWHFDYWYYNFWIQKPSISSILVFIYFSSFILSDILALKLFSCKEPFSWPLSKSLLSWFFHPLTGNLQIVLIYPSQNFFFIFL